MLNSISFNPFPNLIHKFNYNFDTDTLVNKVRESHYSAPESLSMLEQGDAYSSVGQLQPHTWPETKDFQEWLEPVVDQVWDEYHFRKIKKYIGGSWYNVHLREGETLEHPHAHVDIVASCYVKAPAGTGNILFRDPLEYHRTNTPITPEREIWHEVPVTTGDVLLFPGWLKHKTQPNATDEERIVFTFNIISHEV